MNERCDEIKYKIGWLIGTLLSFVLYFSGIVGLYLFFRKRLLKKYRIIVITYHRVRDDSKDPDISVSTEMFKKQMAYAKRYFNVVSLTALVNNIEKKIDAPMDKVAITFDDGYKDNFLNAYPVLEKHRLPATIFLISRKIGKNEEFLKINEIKKMKESGIDFGSHTLTHPILAEIDIDVAAEEILNSRRQLEKMLNDKIKFFAYPKGKRRHFNEQIKALVKESGYKAAFTTENGEIDSESDLFELRRIGIRNCPSFVFKVRISGIFESRLFHPIRKTLRLT